MSHLNNHFVSSHVLKINVGFLLHQSVGYSRTIEFELPRVQVAADVELDYLHGPLRLTRTRHGVLVQGKLTAGLQTECVRCLEEMVLHLDLEIEELYVYPPTPQAEFAVNEDGILNLAPLLREEAIVHMPMRVICQLECRGLCVECGQNLNTGTCTCEKETIDPRFAILKQLQVGD